MHIKLLQAAQRPWNVNTFQHALFHAAKAVGNLAGLVDDADHLLARRSSPVEPGDFDPAIHNAAAEAAAFAAAFDPGGEGRKFVADLVAIALKLASEYPGGAFDLERAVVDRMREKGALASVVAGEEQGSAATQAEIDAAARQQAEEIVDASRLTSLDMLRCFAVNWVETALRYARNEAYWRDRAELAEGRAAELSRELEQERARGLRSSELGAFRELAAEQERTRELRAELAVVRTSIDGVWRWQGDGAAELGSLSCPVVMSADRLRLLLAGRDPLLPSTTGGPLALGEWRVAPTDDGGALVRVGEVVGEKVRVHYPDGACNALAAVADVEK
jgi:hypothetical protein